MSQGRDSPGVSIPRITFQEEVGRGTQSRVYRVLYDNRGPYALKLPNPDPSGGADAWKQFHREASILARVSHSALPRILEVGDSAGRPYLVMELIEGESLAERLDRGPLDPGALVPLALELASGLGQVHGYGLLHRDLKPKNILLTPSGAPKIIDFGLAGVAARTDRDEIEPSEEVVGTIQYASPEQVGFLKRPTDPRSDLYSLGVVLYECWTGRPPFSSRDVGELIRMHGTAVPEPLAAGRSPALAAVILKLLAKDPDDRYQSALGLLADLRNLARLDEELARSPAGDTSAAASCLGREDGRAELLTRIPMVGREKELTSLRERWSQVLKREGAMAIVEGEPGSGKSRLISELAEGASGSGVVVLRCKCSPGGSVPFGPLRQSVEQYLRRLGSLPEAESARIETHLKQELGALGPALRSFSPGLGRLLPEATTASETVDSSESFPLLVSSLLAAISTGHAGLLWIIDDVQWLDESSLSSLRSLARRMGRSRIFLLASARNNPESQEALERFLVEASEANPLRISLQPLSESDVGRLVEAHLGGGGRRVEEKLIARIATRSNGSPLAVAEYLRAMSDSGLLSPSWDTWRVDDAGLERLALPTDVVQLIVKRIENLSTQAMSFLKSAATIGGRFELDLVAAVTGFSEREALDAASEAVRANVLEPQEEGELAFVHDKVQEAVLSSLGKTELAELHQRIAGELERKLPGETPDILYAVARHYGLGKCERDPEKVWRSNLEAGLAALENHGAGEAYQFLLIARRFLPESDRDAATRLLRALGSACFRTGRLQESIAALKGAIEGTTDPLARAVLRTALARSYLATYSSAEAAAAAREGFRELGWNVESGFGAWPRVFWNVFAGLAEKALGLGLKPSIEEERRARVLLNLYETLALSSFLALEQGAMIQALLTTPRFLRRIGPCREKVYVQVSNTTLWGAIWCNLRGLMELTCIGPLSGLPAWLTRKLKEACDRSFDVIHEEAARAGDPSLIAHVAVYRLITHSFLVEDEACPAALTTLHEHGDWISPEDRAYLLGTIAYSLVARGYLKEIVALTEGHLRALGEGAPRHSERGSEAGFYYYWMVGSLCSLGRRAEVQRWRKKAETIELAGPSAKVVSRNALMASYLEQGELGAPLDELIAEAKASGIGPMRRYAQLRLYDVYLLQTFLARVERAKPGERGPLLRDARRALRTLGYLAGTATLRAHHLAGKAAWQRLRGRPRRAWRLLRKAEEHCAGLDVPFVVFEIAREKAFLWQEQGMRPAALHEARVAHGIAMRHGWLPRIEKISREFGLDDEGHGSTASVTRVQGDTAPGNASVLKRQIDALLQISRATARIFDPDEQAKICLRESIQLLGAERAFLLVSQEKGQTESAEALVVRFGMDSDGNLLQEQEGSSISRSVAERARAERRTLVLNAGEEGTVDGTRSIVAHRLRSILAAPLLIGDRVVGVLYLDSRIARGVFSEEDSGILMAIATQVATSLESARAVSEELRRRSLEGELALAGAVQTLLLPKDVKAEHGALRVAASYRPAAQLGGDWWWCDERPDGRCLFLVGDVTGHGPGAAMMTAAVASGYQALRSLEPEMESSRVLEFLNRHLIAVSGDSYSMTFSILELDAGRTRLDFWNAAGSPLFILREDDGPMDILLAKSTPLGVASFEAAQVHRELRPGDRVFAFTDGIHSFIARDGSRFSFLKLQKLFRETAGMSTELAKDHVMGHVLSLQPEAGPEDDITLLVLDFLHVPGV